jgi:hypothetical protein
MGLLLPSYAEPPAAHASAHTTLVQAVLERHAAEFTTCGFDIAGNCLDSWFAGREADLPTTGCLRDDHALPVHNDAVFCTDVMAHVPAVLRNLRLAATRAFFLGFALFPDSFGPKILGASLHLGIISGAVVRNQEESPMWLYLLCRTQAAG